MTPRFVCTFPVVPTEEKAQSWWNSLHLHCVVWLLPHSPDVTSIVWDISPCQGVGEYVFSQEYMEISAITASGVLVAQHSGWMLQGWSRNRQGVSSWCPCNTHGPNLTDLLSILQCESEGDYGPGVQQEVSVKEGERVLNNLGTVWERLGSVYMAHEPKVEKDWIFLIIICCAGVGLGVEISGLSLWKVATTGNRSTLFLGGSTSQNFLNMSICFHWDLGK